MHNILPECFVIKSPKFDGYAPYQRTESSIQESKLIKRDKGMDNNKVYLGDVCIMNVLCRMYYECVESKQ